VLILSDCTRFWHNSSSLYCVCVHSAVL